MFIVERKDNGKDQVAYELLDVIFFCVAAFFIGMLVSVALFCYRF